MTISEYRAHSALNYSLAKHLLRSPAHYMQLKLNPTPPTLEMRIGTQIHRHVEGVGIDAVQKPEHHQDDASDLWHGNKKWCKEWLAASEPDKTFCFDDFARIHNTAFAIDASSLAQRLLKAAPERERAVVCEYRGTTIKALLDMVGTDADGKRFIVDLKTTTDASESAFIRNAKEHRYAMQAAWYTNALAIAEGLEYRPAFIWLVVETEDPHGIAAYVCPDAAMEEGQQQMDTAIDLWAECAESGKWPSYSSEIVVPSWPTWKA
jgi:hypothetical protein